MSGRDKYGKRLRYLCAVCAVLETMLFGGIVNGWASLVYVLKEDGLYGDLCDMTPVGTSVNYTTTIDEQAACPAQDGMLNLWFTIAAALRNIYGILVGLYIFRFGTRAARLTGWMLFVAGALMMAFANEHNPWLVLPSLLTLSYGGVSLLLTNVQVSCLFPRAAGVIVSLVSGAFDMSAATQLVVKVLHDAGLLSRLYSYVSLACLHAVLVLLSTVCLMPSGTFSYQSSQSSQDDETPSPSRLTRRRSSLYDWSEIKAHANQLHRLKCSKCEDCCCNEIEQQELTIRGTLALREDLKEQSQTGDLKGRDLDTEERTGPAGDVNHSEGDGQRIDGVQTKTSTNSRQTHSSPGCHQSGHGGSKPYLHCLDDLNHNTPIDAISASLNKTGRPSASAVDCQDITHISCEPALPETLTRGMTAVNGKEGEINRQNPGGRRSVTVQLGSDDSPDDAASLKTSSVDWEEAEEEKARKGEEEIYPTLKSCVTCTVFWLHVLWMSVNVLRLVAFFGLLNPKLTAMFHGDKDKVSFFTNVQAYCMLAVLAVCWISGAVYDWQSSLLKDQKQLFARRVLPGALPLAMTSLVGVAISVLWMIDSEVVLYVMFALLVFYNAFIFSICMGFTLRVFPERYFGILNGLVNIIVGIFCFLQYAIFRWHDAYSQGPLHAGVFMLSLVVVSFLHPVYIVVTALR